MVSAASSLQMAAFLGVATCLIGVGALILADVLVEKYGDSSKFVTNYGYDYLSMMYGSVF